MTSTIRAYARRDLEWLLGLNNRFAAEMGVLSVDDIEGFAALGGALRVASVRPPEGDEAMRAGFLVLLPSGTAYRSANYRWFETNMTEPFAYIDRVAIDPAMSGRGLGRALYEDAEAIAKDWDRRVLTCEVNERPPNPASMAFHRRLGFAALETRENAESGKRVVMMEKHLDGVA